MAKKGRKICPKGKAAAKRKFDVYPSAYAKKDGKYQPCGRKNAKTSKRKYPKCVPAAKAAGMSKSQKASAVSRKRAKAQGVGGKPTMVKTKGGGMAKKKFPDLSGDGKVTQKDVLMGRGVVQKAVAGKLIKGAAKTIAKKNKKKFSEADLRRFEKETKADMKKFNIKPKAQTLTKKEKIILPAAKIAAPIGIGAGAYALNETYKGIKSTINAEKTLKGVDEAFSKKTKRKEKKNISQADIIGKERKVVLHLHQIKRNLKRKKVILMRCNPIEFLLQVLKDLFVKYQKVA